MSVNSTRIFAGFMIVVLSCLLLACTEQQTASDLDCEDLANHSKGEVLSNAMGGQFEILKVTNANQISRSDTSLVCEGDARLSSGTISTLKMTYEQDSDGEWWLMMESD